jgi:hypothetical protein
MANQGWCVLCVTLLNGYLISCAGQNNSLPMVIHKVPVKDLLVPATVLARRDGIPAGVIVGRESYCALVPAIADSFAHGTVMQAFEQIANATGGSVTTDGEVLVLRVGTPPKRLSKTLSFKFPRFPKVDGTLPDVGAVLDGWMLSTLPGKKALARPSVSHPVRRSCTSRRVGTCLCRKSLTRWSAWEAKPCG